MSSNGLDQELGAQAHAKAVALTVEVGKLIALVRELKTDIVERISGVVQSGESTQRQVNALIIAQEAHEKRSEARHRELLSLLVEKPKVRRLPKAARSR